MFLEFFTLSVFSVAAFQDYFSQEISVIYMYPGILINWIASPRQAVLAGALSLGFHSFSKRFKAVGVGDYTLAVLYFSSVDGLLYPFSIISMTLGSYIIIRQKIEGENIALGPGFLLSYLVYLAASSLL